MFTKDNTMDEILNTELVKRAIGNLDLEVAETGRFEFIPLWGRKDDVSAWEKMPHWKNGIPDADLNTEEGVWLFTGNPAVDNMAFAHTAGKESIPPYESIAGSKKNVNDTDLKPAVIICPGGGYEMKSYYNEGIQIAQRMERDGGYKAFILSYRIRPNYYPLPQMDLARSIMYVRAHATEYRADPKRIVVVGASAGGHLCASEAVFYKELKENVIRNLLKFQNAEVVEKYKKISARPDAVGLLYPVISFSSDYHEGSYLNNTNGNPQLKKKLSLEFQIQPEYPITYAYANADDSCVPVSNTVRLNEALEKAGVIHLCEIYPSGDHGIGLGYNTSAKMWSENMLKFFDQYL